MVGLIILTLGWAVIFYELWRAPYMDKDGNVIKQAKTFKDLFKRKNNYSNHKSKDLDWDDNKIHSEGNF